MQITIWGQGAGFYVNATRPPWSSHFRMEDYIVRELPKVVSDNFKINGRFGVMGHSMGGHGALTLYLNHPDVFTSCSAFAPICSPH